MRSKFHSGDLGLQLDDLESFRGIVRITLWTSSYARRPKCPTTEKVAIGAFTLGCPTTYSSHEGSGTFKSEVRIRSERIQKFQIWIFSGRIFVYHWKDMAFSDIFEDIRESYVSGKSCTDWFSLKVPIQKFWFKSSDYNN